MGMVCTVLECIWWGYGMHIMRMYMVLVCTVLECIWVWYAQYENVYKYGMPSMKIYMCMVCTVLECIRMQVWSKLGQ